MTTTVRDSNGSVLRADVRREADGTWGRTVWFGGLNGLGTTERRYFYETREAARNGDISDAPGKNGRVR